MACISQQYLKSLTITENISELNNVQEIVIKESKFNSHKITPWRGNPFKKCEFRPEVWEQFIGQTEAKERAKTIIAKAHQGMKAHFLVDGIQGHGKTAFCELLAKDLKANVIKCIGKQVDEDYLVDIINKINASDNPYVMLFIDELDTIHPKILKILNPIIESFEYEGIYIKPFIFAGATINKHVLVKNNPDTLDRIPNQIKFSRYNEKEIYTILKQYKNQLYYKQEVLPAVLEVISKNCKYNPRLSIGLLEDYIVIQNIIEVLQNNKILKDGLTNIDFKILAVLYQSPKPLGVNCLALKSGLNPQEYERIYEPFLLEYGYINRIPSRIITDKGKELLQ